MNDEQQFLMVSDSVNDRINAEYDFRSNASKIKFLKDNYNCSMDYSSHDPCNRFKFVFDDIESKVKFILEWL